MTATTSSSVRVRGTVSATSTPRGLRAVGGQVRQRGGGGAPADLLERQPVAPEVDAFDADVGARHEHRVRRPRAPRSRRPARSARWPSAAAMRRIAIELPPGAERARLPGRARRAVGLGDDCGVLVAVDAKLVVSTDVSVEGIHFRRDWLTLEEIGWRATAAALSDLAADGAEAAGVLVALTVPSETADEEVVAVMLGAGAAAVEVGAVVVGGDLSAGPAWNLAVTVLGWASAPVTRAGARAGDGLWVTGALGGPRAALEAWQRGAAPGDDARRAFARPVPRIHAGRWLARHGAHAMVDLSDGLGADAAHLAAASAPLWSSTSTGCR